MEANRTSLLISRRLWNYNRLKEVFCTPYYGYHFNTNADYTGKHSQYRYHIQDPIPFQQSLLFSIEHCHCVELLPVEKRLPRLWGGLHI